MLTNSGELRFDIFSGMFTRNDQFTSLPFADAFLFIPNVSLSVANAVLPALNVQSADTKRALREGREAELYARGNVDARYMAWLEEMARRDGAREKRAAANLTLGYVTTDVSSSPCRT